MSSLDESFSDDGGSLSPTASIGESMVSMKTENHNELYDHRQHAANVNVNTNANANANAKTNTNTSKNTNTKTNTNVETNPNVASTNPSSTGVAKRERRMSKAHSISTNNSNMGNKLAKTNTQKSDNNINNPRNSFDSENSQASRESQETEEDVCFPMAPALHTRVNGIDFDELEEFAIQVNEQKQNYYNSMTYHKDIGDNGTTSEHFSREKIVDSNSQGHNTNIKSDQAITSSSSSAVSSAAVKYTPKHENLLRSTSTTDTSGSQNNINNRPSNGIYFGNNKIEEEFEEESKDNINDNFSKSSKTNNTYHKKFDDYYNAVHNDKTPDNDGYYQQLQNNQFNQNNFNCPIRYSFFCSESEETVHAEDIASLVKPGESYSDLFHGGEPTWWLDCSCPTDDEMRCIAKAFGIHPLTAEDIRMQETREKVEMFKSYYFICFHTFENDKESEDYLEPINVYIVVLRTGILTFHFGPISHSANVRRRVRQLRDYVNVSSDWLCYALIDDITDGFAPVIQSIEYEADTIEDSVFMVNNLDFAGMLKKIGESRRKVMTLMRLLSGKADVIKMFAKRCQDEHSGIGPALTSYINIANLQAANNNMNYNADIPYNFSTNSPNNPINSSNLNSTNSVLHPNPQQSFAPRVVQPRSDIALYLGDIQDHLLTMYQNLLAYEKIFSRSHSNYLAQLQVESFNSNNKVTEMLGKVTMIGTMLVPLNVITGLFGMNVTVPGEASSIAWWFGILGVLILLGIGGWFLASYWVAQIGDSGSQHGEHNDSSARSIITNLFPRGARGARNYRNNSNNDRGRNSSNRSIQSLPSRYSRYN